MARRRTRRRSNPFRRRTRRRSNPSSSLLRSNPSGLSGMVVGGAWIYAGMWLGGIVGGFIPSIGSGVVGSVINGALRAYLVGFIGARFTRNAGLMAAGAFAPTVGSLLGGVLGGVGGLVSGVTSSLTASTPKQSGATGAAQVGATGNPNSNVIQMPVSGGN